MATCIALRDDCLDDPRDWDVRIVEAHMLWPGDDAMRARFLQVAVVRNAMTMIADLPAPTPDEAREIAETIYAAPRAEDITEAAQDAYVDGVIAGELLRRAVGYADLRPTEAKLKDIKAVIAASLWRTRSRSAKTIDNVVWPAYRSVAHLWAAYLHRAKETGRDAFPTMPGDLTVFLGVAEAYRRRGETTRSAPTAPAILRAGEAIALPTTLAPPAVDLIFAEPG